MRISSLALAVWFLAIAAAAQPPSRAGSSPDERLADSHYRSGWELLAAEKWEQAGREFQAAIDGNPGFKLAYYGLGRASMGQKRFADAIAAYERCRDLYLGQASQNFANKGEAERMMADDVMQIDMTISRLQSGPQTPEVSAQIAQMNMLKQRLQNRLTGTGTMSLSSEAPPFVSLALGSAYFRAQRFADAEQSYKKALESDSKYGQAHNNLAALYLITGRYNDAAAAVKAAEKTGFHVNPAMKDEIEKKRKGGG